MNWQTKTLGEVATIDRKGVSPNEIELGTEFIGLEHIESGGKILGSHTVENGDISSTKFRFNQSHVLYGKLRPYLAKIALPAFAGVCSTDILPIAPGPHLDRRYLAYFLRQPSMVDLATCRSTGANLPRLSPKTLAEFTVPLPPIEEQRRIAEILDKADAIRRKRKEAIRLTESLLRSAFLDMFGDPVTNPNEWTQALLSEVITKIEAGWSAKGEEKACSSDEWGVLKISAVTSGWFNPNENKTVENPTFKKKPVIPQKGDLLFSRANTRELVAATCLVEKDYSNIFLPDKLWRILTNKNQILPEYLRFLLSDTAFRQLITRQATGTSGSMLNVSQKKLLGIKAPIPPIQIQEKFRKFVWQVFQERDLQLNAYAHSEKIFSSILQRAFRGQL